MRPKKGEQQNQGALRLLRIRDGSYGEPGIFGTNIFDSRKWINIVEEYSPSPLAPASAFHGTNSVLDTLNGHSLFRAINYQPSRVSPTGSTPTSSHMPRESGQRDSSKIFTGGQGTASTNRLESDSSQPNTQCQAVDQELEWKSLDPGSTDSQLGHGPQ